MTATITRRAAIGGAFAAAFPTIVPASVLGAAAPSTRINVGAIGVGRISRGHDMKEMLRHADAHIVAVCDVNARRLAAGRAFVDAAYADQRGKAYAGTRAHDDYRALLADGDIDAVLISTPDHQHARLAIDAVRAGKDVYLRKPASLTISEGRNMADAVKASGRILQIGSQQRGQEPWPQFHRACELVRNGRVGQLRRVEVWGKAEFPKSGLWDVHGAFETHARYANGVVMTISGALPNGVKFIGDKGWIFVTRSGSVTSSDPAGPQAAPLLASDRRILDSVIDPHEVRLRRTPEQHRDWLDAIRTRGPVSAPAEVGHRACSTCLLHWTAMKTGRRLRWDPAAERFIGDDAANAMLSRPQA